MELFQILFELLMAVSPQVATAVLVLGTLLFGFCSYIFFDSANVVGGVVFLLLALLTLVLLVYAARQGRFEGKKSGKNKKQ